MGHVGPGARWVPSGRGAAISLSASKAKGLVAVAPDRLGLVVIWNMLRVRSGEVCGLRSQAPIPAAAAGPVGGAEAGCVVGGLPRLPQAIRGSFCDAGEPRRGTVSLPLCAPTRAVSRSG